MKRIGIWLLVVGDHPRSESAALVEVLSRGELDRVHLKIANTTFVKTTVSGYIIHRFSLGNVPSPFAYDDGQFSFIVEVC